MVKVLIIEPHGDDAICSCSSILRNKNLDIDILTLGISRSSNGLKSLFTNLGSVSYKELPELDYNLRPKVSTHDIHRRYLNGEEVNLYYRSLLENYITDCDRVNLMYRVRDELKSISLENYDYILYPLGLVHPYHILVNDAVHSYCFGRFPLSKFIMYADKPYVGTRYAKECMESFCRFNQYYKITAQYDTREQLVGEVLKEVYPTELGMLRFSGDILLREPDIYISKDLTFKEDLFNEDTVCNAI